MSCLPRTLHRLLGSSLRSSTPRLLRHSFKTPHSRRFPQQNARVFSSSSPTPSCPSPRHASFSLWTLALSALVLCGGFALHSTSTDVSAAAANDQLILAIPEEDVEFFIDDNMSAPAAELTETGYYLNLTEEQEAKLKELWIAIAKVTGIVKDGDLLGKIPSTPKTEEPKPVKRGWFGSKKADDSAQETDDKFGLAKEYQKALGEHTPEELRLAFWHMAKADHPDSLLLRFLRARKWDVQRALIMLISAVHWRISEVHVDDEIMRRGDGGLLTEAEEGNDAATKKESDDFFKMLRNGQSYVRGRDHQGRPICYIRVKLHKIGAHPGRTIERMTVYHIETSRLLLQDRVETACVIFDMTGFTLANMDYAPVKYLIRCFEANYPESLGHILLHNAPWIFQSIWQVIKGWMDPVVVSKVHFTKSVEDVEQYVPRSDIPKSMGGDDDYDYEYVDPVKGENEMMKDASTRDSLLAVRLQHAQDFQDATVSWLTTTGDNKELKEKRHAIAQKMRENYWLLDPYVRARAMVDRQGLLQSPYAAKPAAGSKAVSVSEKTHGEVVTTKPVAAEVNAS